MRAFMFIFRRFRLASILNLLGLTTAFVAYYVFATQVSFNSNYNKNLHDHEHLYRLETYGSMFGNNWGAHTPRIIEGLLKDIAHVEDVIVIGENRSILKTKKGESEITIEAVFINGNGIKDLNDKVVSGTLEMETTDQCVIPVSMAETYFGTVDAAGMSIMMSDGGKMEVVGVYEDFAENCMMENRCYRMLSHEGSDDVMNWNFNYYCHLSGNADTEEISNLIKQNLVSTVMAKYADTEMEVSKAETETIDILKYRMTPVSETYFSGVDVRLDRGNKGLHTIMELACILVIIVAGINFVNFTLAETPMRIKSINTRKVLGSSTASLRMSLIAESIMIALIAFAIASMIIYPLSQWPTFMQLVVGSIGIGDNMTIWLMTLAIAIVVGIASGVYPAYYVTSFPPALALKGTFGLSSEGRMLRKILIGVQMVAAFTMVVYIAILFMQSDYIFNSDYGYAKDEIVFTEIDKMSDEQREALRNELCNISGIVDVSYTMDAVGVNDEYMIFGRGDSEHSVYINAMPVDCHFINTYGIKIIEGRDFNEYDGDVYIINKATRQACDWVEIGKPLVENDLEVVGVCENIRFGSTRVDNDNRMCAFMLFGERFKDWVSPYNVANIRVGANVDKIEMMKRIKDKITEVTGEVHAHEIQFIDQRLQITYKDEMRFIKQVEIFSLICLIITIVGIFCLTMFETEYRRKEIGIRKVMGSSVKEVLMLISKQYVPLVLTSFAIAAPMAYYMGNNWLQNFSEHTEIHWWLFPLSLTIVAVIVMATVVSQSYKAAIENPINSIKSE